MNLENLSLSAIIQISRGFPVNFSEEDRSDYQGFGEYRTYTATLRHIRNAMVSADSLFYKNLFVDRESLYWDRYLRYYQINHLAKKLLFAKMKKLGGDTKYLLATDQESHGHFHWLTEVLPRLWLIRDHSQEFALLLPDRPYLRSIGLESLELLGMRFSDIVWMNDDEFLRVPNLFHISKVAPSGQMNDPIMKELREAFIGPSQVRSGKLYISRSDAKRRKILNDSELAKMLRSYGFETFVGEGMCLKDQVKVFSESRIVVGIHGAGLTNSIFMHPGTVIEIKKKEPTYAYWNLAGSLGHDYYYYNGIPDSEQSLIGTGCNLTVPVSDFEQKIIARLASS